MIFMKNRFFSSFLILAFALLCLTGCASKSGKLMKSAQASYQANDYEAALRDTVTILIQKPNHVEAQNFVQIFFNAAVKASQDRIAALEETSAQFKWDEIVAEYNRLIEMNTLVQGLLPLTHKKTKQQITFETQDYSRQLAEASEKAAEAHYQAGIRLSDSSDDVETQKQAAKEFKTAESFVPSYKDAQSRYEQTRSAGTKKIAILTVHDTRLLGTVTDNIISAVLEDIAASEFLTIIPRSEFLTNVPKEKLLQIIVELNSGLFDKQAVDKRIVADIGKALNVHEIVFVHIDKIDYTPPQTTSTTSDREDTERKKTGTKTIFKDGKTKKVPQYSNVTITAKFTHYQRKSAVSVVSSYRIIDGQTAKLKKTEDFTTKHEFTSEWGSFTGDKDALKKADSLLLNKEKHAPAESVMVSEALDKLSSEIAEALKAYGH